jgi:hypothetical protein
MTEQREENKVPVPAVPVLDQSTNPAVQAANEQTSETDGIRVFSTGVRVRLKSVSASLIDDVRARIKDPVVPTVHDEEKDRDLQNPNDPAYLRALEEADEARAVAAVDAMIMFGVELVDEIPENTDWIKRLAMLGIEVDESNKFAVEFAFKKYIAVGTPDLPQVYTASAPVTTEGVAKAMAGFPGTEGRTSNPGDPDS